MSTFRHVGGDVFFGSIALDDAGCQHLRDVYLDEVAAFGKLGDVPRTMRARNCLASLSLAIRNRNAWRRAAAAPKEAS